MVNFRAFTERCELKEMRSKMKITKRQLRRIIREEKEKILEEAKTLDDLPTHNEAFLSAMRRIMDSLLQQPPKMRVQHAETLIANLESIIDQALSGLPDSQGRKM